MPHEIGSIQALVWVVNWGRGLREEPGRRTGNIPPLPESETLPGGDIVNGLARRTGLEDVLLLDELLLISSMVKLVGMPCLGEGAFPKAKLDVGEWSGGYDRAPQFCFCF